MKKTLVPVDFSVSTEITCRYAIEFLRFSGGEIRLFHTYFDQILLSDTSFPDTPDISTLYSEELVNVITQQAERNIRELEEQVKRTIREEQLANITVSHSISGGELEHELTLACREFHPDLVIMGATGKGRSVRVWGKVSSLIIEKASVPVMTIPEISGFQGFGRIMLATDLAEENVPVIAGLMEMFLPAPSTINVVHFMPQGKPTDARARMKNLQMKFSGEEQSGKALFEVVEVADDNQSAIDQYVRENRIGMIAFHPQHHSLLYLTFTRNITRKNFFATRIPLLSVPSR